MKYDFITIGGAAEDITFFADDGVLLKNHGDLLKQELLAFEYGAKIEIDKVFYNFGGGAANAAVCLARLGFRVANIGSIGDDERGRRIIANFKKHGVDGRLVQKIKGEESSFSFILVGPSRDRIIFFSRGAERQLLISAEGGSAFGGNDELLSLRKTKWAYITALSGGWQNNLKKVFGVKNLKIVWNPGNGQIKAGLGGLGKFLKKTEVFIVNKDEALELAVSDRKYKKRGGGFLNNIDNLLKIIYRHGPKIVVITDGKKGARAFDGQNFYFQPIIKEKRRADTTGVGDAFGSSFVAGLELYKGDIKKAMRLGARNSASVIAEIGAQNGLIKLKIKNQNGK